MNLVPSEYFSIKGMGFNTLKWKEGAG